VTARPATARRPALARTRRPAAPRTRRPAAPRTLVLVAVLALVAALSIVLSTSGADKEAAISPLRVTSGGEIATGFAVGRDRVVTVAHVLGGAPAVNGRHARVVRVDRRSDIALLSVPGLTASGQPSGPAGEPAIADVAGAGARLRVLRLRSGRSSSLSVHVRRAIVAHVRALGAAQAVTRPALELAGRVAAGDSGAPVVSDSGALAGVIFAASRRREGTAYAVDASAVALLLARDHATLSSFAAYYAEKGDTIPTPRAGGADWRASRALRWRVRGRQCRPPHRCLSRCPSRPCRPRRPAAVAARPSGVGRRSSCPGLS
jgi:hypothetical protein